jgi:hypothetical protein
MLTVTLFVTVPPTPVHWRVKVEPWDKVPVDSEPLVERGPLHPPLAVQDVALLDDQVSVELSPPAIDSGSAASVSVGAGGAVTLTVTLSVTVPPLPTQESV